MAKQHRIGILGGTFDPIHSGHIRMGLLALESGRLDQLLVIPAGNPPAKCCTAPAEDRWKMVVAACSCDKRLVPFRLEIDRDGSSYTIDTLLEISRKYSKASLCFVLGSDALMTLRQWNRLDEILPLCSFMIFPRVGSDPAVVAAETDYLKSLGGHFSLAEAVPADISSSDIRSSLASGILPSSLNPAVGEYCACKGLYGFPGRLDRIDEWMDCLFSALNAKRFAHSLSVASAAVRLARLHGLDPVRAEQAGLLHDCAKCLPLEEMRRIAFDHSLTDDPAFLSSSALLHSVTGAWVAEHQYGMKDPDVLDAIRYHNTGCPGMSRLAMCICLADSIEPLRSPYPRLGDVRALAGVSLERALLLSLERTADYVLSRGMYLHPLTRETIQWLRTLPAVTRG